MTLDDYQKFSRETAIYPDLDHNFVYPTLGLTGEAGEVANKIKKIFRDGQGVMTEAKSQELAKELGDVLWYTAQLATELHLSMDQIATQNLERLASRKERGTLHGDGDNR